MRITEAKAPMTSAQQLALLKIVQTKGLCAIPPITRRSLRQRGFITYVRLPLGRFQFTITEAGKKALDATATHSP